MNLTSMNGERRLRLSEKYMDRYGNSKPDCLIAAALAQNMERVLREMGQGSAIVEMLSDYAVMREQARACDPW